MAMFRAQGPPRYRLGAQICCVWRTSASVDDEIDLAAERGRQQLVDQRPRARAGSAPRWPPPAERFRRPLLARNTELTRPLMNPDYFKRFFLDLGALCWPNGFELSPEAIHQRLDQIGALHRTARVA